MGFVKPTNINLEEYFDTLKLMIAELQDGHGLVRSLSLKSGFGLPTHGSI